MSCARVRAGVDRPRPSLTQQVVLSSIPEIFNENKNRVRGTTGGPLVTSECPGGVPALSRARGRLTSWGQAPQTHNAASGGVVSELS